MCCFCRLIYCNAILSRHAVICAANRSTGICTGFGFGICLSTGICADCFLDIIGLIGDIIVFGAAVTDVDQLGLIVIKFRQNLAGLFADQLIISGDAPGIGLGQVRNPSSLLK